MTLNDLTLCRNEVADLLALDEGLSDWEIKFVEDMDKRFEDPLAVLSAKQEACLHRIWDKLCK